MKHALILVLMLAACGDDGGTPDLMPTDQILAEPALPAHANEARIDAAPVQQANEARADALRARADALRGPVVDPALTDRARQ